MIKTIDSDFSKQEWNNCVNHPLQLWEWGEARKKLSLEVLRIGDFEGSKLKKVFQITFHRIPYTKYKIGYLPRSKYPSKETLDFLYKFGKENNILFIKFEPYIRKEEIPHFARNDMVTKSPHPLFPDWTQIIDLTRSEEELLKGMKPKTRYNIKLGQKKGLIVKEMTNSQGFEIFAKLYFATTKRQKYYGHDYNYHKTIFESLKDSFSNILITYFDNIPLCAYELFHHKDILYYVYGGSSESYRNLMAPHLLMWESIRFGKKLGLKKFDMWGSLSPEYDQKHPWAGFTRFKEGFGGQFVELGGSFDQILNPALYRLYNIAFAIRTKYLEFKLSLGN